MFGPLPSIAVADALLDNPDLAIYKGKLGGKYVVHLLPVVLGEIDELKRGGRNEDLRNNARRAERRLKGIRSNGNVLEGVRVAGDVSPNLSTPSQALMTFCPGST